MDTPYGISHFLSHLDPVGTGVLAVLAAFSIASWSVILLKVAQLCVLWVERRRGDPCPPGSARSRIAARGRVAADRLGAGSSAARFAPSAPERLVVEALSHAVLREQEHLEKGLTLVSTTSSAAPFVGLFGTVWSIYHALVAIGASGDGGLDKVAGPVGEALIMTGIGLAVALPALVAHNALAWAHRRVGLRDEAFALECYARLSTGARADGTPVPEGLF